MPVFSGIKAVVTDIEGTTSSISFVHDVLFPYAAAQLPGYVREHAHEPEVAAILEQVDSEAGVEEASLDQRIEQLLRWIREDRKVTPLKSLQGLVWEAGYRQGDYRAHVYADVAPELRAWKSRGLALFVYSSGSVLAQKLFFEFSQEGNLLTLFDGHFDTQIGAKREAQSYQAIATQVETDPAQLLFLSDIPAELEAARSVGYQVCLLRRPGNAEAGMHDFPTASRFSDIRIN